MNIVFFTQQRGKSTALLIIIAALAIAVGLLAHHKNTRDASMPSFDKLIMLPNSKPLGAVNFIDHNGQPFGISDLKGKWSVLFFAFTNCPDICPTTLQMLRGVKQELTDSGTWPAFQIVMVSVDPERDTPERLKQYVPFFDPEFIGLAGELDYTTQFAKNLGILFFRGKTLKGGGYDVDHSAALILVDPNGEYAGVLSAPHVQSNLAKDLEKLGQYALKQQTIRTESKLASSTADLSNTELSDTKSTSDDDEASLNAQNLVFENAWIRPAPPQASSMAGYFQVTNNSKQPAIITDATSPDFDMIMIHQTVIENGVAKMQHMDGLNVDAGETITLKPMAEHLMLMRPEKALPIGSTVAIKLTLNTGEIIDLSIDVKDNPNTAE